MSSLRRTLVWLAAGAAAAIAYLLLARPWDLALFAAVQASPALAVGLGIRWYRPARPSMWLLVGAGMLVAAVPNAVSFATRATLPVPETLPFLSAACDLTAFVLVIAGAAQLARVQWAHAGSHRTMDAAVVGAGLGLVVWVFVVEPYVQATARGAPAGLSLLVTPFLDIVVLSILGSVFVAPAARSPSYRILAFAVLVHLAANSVTAVAVLDHWYRLGGGLDAISLAAYVLVGAAAVHPGMAVLAAPPPVHGTPRPLSARRLVLLTAIAVVVPGLVVLQAMLGRRITADAVGLGTVLVFVLAVVAMNAIVRELGRQRAELDGAMAALSRGERERRALLGATVRAVEDERKALANELHDGPIQRLSAVGILLERVRLGLVRDDRRAALALLAEAGERISQEIGVLRRTMGELRPPVLDERGLGSALRDHAAALGHEAGLDCDVAVELDRRLSPPVETVLYRVAQEALANVVKHAGVRSAKVSLRREDGAVVLEVADLGVGFDPDAPEAPEASIAGERVGLLAMRERVEMIGGRWELDAGPGRGTRVRAVVPMEVARP